MRRWARRSITRSCPQPTTHGILACALPNTSRVRTNPHHSRSLTRRTLNPCWVLVFSETPFNTQAVGALVGSAIALILLVVVISRLYPLAPSAETLLGAAPQVDPAILDSSVARMGRSFVSADAYFLPFELASVLLLAALVGSIIIAWPRRGEEDNL